MIVSILLSSSIEQPKCNLKQQQQIVSIVLRILRQIDNIYPNNPLILLLEVEYQSMNAMMAAMCEERAIAAFSSDHSWVVFDHQQGRVQSSNDVIATGQDQPSPKEA